MTDDTVALIAFAAVAIGFGWIYPPLGLIVPGLIVFAALAFKHLFRGGPPGA